MDGNAFIGAMSESDIREQLEKYKDNPSVVTLLEGVLEARVREEAERKAEADFEKAIGRIVSKLPHPEKVHNIYIRWGEVDIPEGEPEEMALKNGGAYKLLRDLTPEDHELVDKGEITIETRTPTRKEYQWISQVNKSVTVTRGGNGTPTVSKRAIMVMKRNGLALQPIGNFPSASKACEYLKIPLGGDSGNRVLAREGYITEAYEGTEYTS